MLQKKQRTTIPTVKSDKQSSRLRKRLREINARSEKDLASLFESIEKAKAAFRSHL